MHPPYTLWHLSYVAIGASAAPRLNGGRLGLTILAFFLAVGLAAHALDELRGRPLATRISDRTLQAIAGTGLVGAVFLGLYASVLWSPLLLPFVAFGVFIVLAYDLELFGGWFHTDAWFAIAWGAFPALTGYVAQAEAVRWQAVLIAGACMLFSAAQRRLSTPVRNLRRRVAHLEGRMQLKDGREITIDESMLREAPEAALRILAVALALLSAGLVAARLS